MIFKIKVLIAVLLVCLLYTAFGDAVRYFPAGMDGLYTSMLNTMHEPSIYQGHFESETYRFLWLRTFHNPIAIRVQKTGDGAQVRVVRLQGAAGYDVGEIDLDRNLKITPRQWNEFVSQVEVSGFWNMPPTVESTAQFDGARWILEGRSSQRYHVVDRWSPVGEPTLQGFVKCCEQLLTLSGIEIKASEKY